MKAKLDRWDLAAVSANVLNHPILSNVHARLQAIMPFSNPIADAVNASSWCDQKFSDDECQAQGFSTAPCEGTECDWTLVRGADGKPALLDSTVVR